MYVVNCTLHFLNKVMVGFLQPLKEFQGWCVSIHKCLNLPLATCIASSWGGYTKFWRQKTGWVSLTSSSGFTDALKNLTLELNGSLQYTHRMVTEYTERHEKEAARKVSRGVILPHFVLCVAPLLLFQTVILVSNYGVDYRAYASSNYLLETVCEIALHLKVVVCEIKAESLHSDMKIQRQTVSGRAD